MLTTAHRFPVLRLNSPHLDYLKSELTLTRQVGTLGLVSTALGMLSVPLLHCPAESMLLG